MEDSIRVLMCGPYPYRGQELPIGIATVLRDLKCGFDLNESDMSLTVVTGNRDAKEAVETHDEIIYLRQPKHKLGSVYLSSYPFKIRRVLKESEFHALSAHTTDFGWYGLAHKEKLVYTLHGVHWEERKHIERYKKPFYDLLYTKRQKKVLKEARYLVSISPHIKSITKGMTSATIFEIPNPVSNAYFNVKDNRLAGRILYLGGISKPKNLLTLVKSLRLVRKEATDFRLVVAGKIADSTYFTDIKQFVRRNSLQDNIDFVGVIGEDQKYEELSRTNFLVLPSFQEIAPCVITESFAAARPVIASNVGGIPHMMDDGRNGFLVHPRDERGLADRILYFLQNPREARLKGRNARKFAERNHALGKIVGLYRRAFEIVSEGL